MVRAVAGGVAPSGGAKGGDGVAMINRNPDWS